MQCDLLDRERFADACTLWATRKGLSLADVVESEGWMDTSDRAYVEDLVKRRLGRAQYLEFDSADTQLASPMPPGEAKVRTEELDDEAADEASRISLQLMGSTLPEDGSLADVGPKVTIRDRISLDGLHSSGGIGEVWRAYDHVLERNIALKRLRRDKASSEVHRERFLREAKLTGQLDHPGIVPVYDYGTEDDGVQSFYTMRFLHGRTLTEVVHKFHAMRRAGGDSLISGGFLELLGHFLSVCNTVAFAHSRGVIHRDLKGDNVIVGDFGEVIVLDWGLAKRLDVEAGGSVSVAGAAGESVKRPDSLAELETIDLGRSARVSVSQTMQGETLGTPSYMSPEQALGQVAEIDYQTDVYGLAALLYEILTGQPPFRGNNVVTLMREVVENPPVPPSELVAGVPDALERACLQGLSKAKDARQEHVRALADQVRNWLTERAERKRVEEERERFFDLSLDLLAIVEDPDRLTQVNQAWQSLLGWTVEECQARSVIELVVHDDRDEMRDHLQAVWSGEPHAAFEVRMATRDEAWRWVDWSARKVPGQDAIYLVGRDITERKRTEREFQGLLESAPDATCVVDDAGIIKRVNRQLETLFGYARDELEGQAVEMLIPQTYRGRHKGHVSGYISRPGFRPMGVGLALVGEKKDGTVFPLEISLGPVETDGGLLISCALRDVSERQRNERRLHGVLNALDDALVVVDEEQRIVMVNQAARQFLGYGSAELVGRELAVLFAERSREACMAHLVASLDGTEGRDEPLYGVRKDGEEIRIELSSVAVPVDGQVLVCCSVRVRS